MSLAQVPALSRKSNRSSQVAKKPTKPIQSLDQMLTAVESSIAPVWPLQDYVAVNPFVGMTDKSFLEARYELQSVRNCEMLLSLSEFRRLYDAGRFGDQDIEVGLEQCKLEYPDIYRDVVADVIVDAVRSTSSDDDGRTCGRAYRCAAEVIDGETGSQWHTTIIDEVSRHLAAHYDRGQAVWSSPWKQQRLYQAWKEACSIDRRMHLMGLSGFHGFVNSLPAEPEDAIAQLLEQAGVDAEHYEGRLLCLLHTVSGWASSIKQRIRDEEASAASGEDRGNAPSVLKDLRGLMAIRLAYDAALLRKYPETSVELLQPVQPPASFDVLARRGAVDSQAVVRYALQTAMESAYRRALASKLLTKARTGTIGSVATGRKLAQFVFCIDVRSELMRRHMESVSDRIETLGFAGFFGLAFEIQSLGESEGSHQCPVLLQPAIKIEERLRTSDPAAEGDALKERHSIRLFRRAWKSFQSSAASTFSFVETLGLLFAPKLLTDTLGWSRPVNAGKFDGLPQGDRGRLGPSVSACSCSGMTVDRQIGAAESILRNMGLTKDFAHFVFLCGHECSTVNNPYQAALNCGACGGHSGEANARVAAAIFNNPQVRNGLVERGIEIPQDTVFVAAVHDTTVDTITLRDEDLIPISQLDALEEVKRIVIRSEVACRAERGELYAADRISVNGGHSAERRSRDWSEVRPEWGLAGNAAFIAAPRSRTEGLNLDGRTFLHNYDYRQDTEGKVLELIMTAPMVVANWINLQYLASTVDNVAFGSGNKTIHNVVGQFGILQGNGGDLMTGLPWQSVHDGKSIRHEPLRLWVVIEAPREKIEAVIDEHAAVRDLICNGWLSLAAIDQGQIWEFRGGSFCLANAPAA